MRPETRRRIVLRSLAAGAMIQASADTLTIIGAGVVTLRVALTDNAIGIRDGNYRAHGRSTLISCRPQRPQQTQPPAG